MSEDVREFLEKLLEFRDADYVPNSLFERAEGLLHPARATPADQSALSADVGHACATKMRTTMVRLGVFPGEGLEWFQANIEDNIYLMCSEVNKLLDAIGASEPKGAGND